MGHHLVAFVVAAAGASACAAAVAGLGVGLRYLFLQGRGCLMLGMREQRFVEVECLRGTEVVGVLDPNPLCCW